MTATTLRARPSRTAAPAGLARLLWIEIKRNPVPWALPLLAVLFFLDTYRTTAGYPPVWTVRASAVPDRLLTDFAAFAGGLSAWAGTREGRRKTGDLLASTVRPAWARRLAALAGTMFWLVLAFLIAVAVLYVQIARAAIWGGPPLWPVAVGVVALVTICVAGFAAGALFPGRFTAPLVAVAAVVLHIVGTHQVNDPDIPSLHDLLSLGANLPPYDQGVFYHVPLDVPIAQIIFMGGITVAAAGLLTWSSKRTVSVALVLAGIAAAVGRPVPYTPDCASPAGFAVCVHPAFGTYLPSVAAALAPVAAEIAGLPGAPVRAAQVPYGAPFYGSPITGTPPVYEFTVTITWVNPAVAGPLVQQGLLSDFIGGPAYAGSGNLGPAQQAVVSALLTAAGVPAQAQALNGPPPPPQVAAAAHRFAALSPAARHAWLAAHLSALRAGQITPAQLP